MSGCWHRLPSFHPGSCRHCSMAPRRPISPSPSSPARCPIAGLSRSGEWRAWLHDEIRGPSVANNRRVAEFPPSCTDNRHGGLPNPARLICRPALGWCRRGDSSLGLTGEGRAESTAPNSMGSFENLRSRPAPLSETMLALLGFHRACRTAYSAAASPRFFMPSSRLNWLRPLV
jgi:hypothetical protein